MALYYTTSAAPIYAQDMGQYVDNEIVDFSDDEILTLLSTEPSVRDLPGETSAEANQAPIILNNGPSRTESTSTSHDHTTDSSNPKLILMPDEDLRITRIAQTDSERITALRLVADSVAQQRQLAARAILFNPFCWALIPLLPTGIYYAPYKDRINLLTLLFVTVGMLMAVGSIVKWSVAGYLDAAEKVSTWRWLYGFEEETEKKLRGHGKLDSDMDDCNCRHIRPRDTAHKRDVVLVARLDPSGEIIGTIILRVIPITHLSKPFSRSNSSLRRCPKTFAPMPNCKAIIRAWTVKQSHRGAGIGGWMLKDAILLCLKYGWMGPEFAKDNANSVHVLPQRFNGWLNKMEVRARRRLSRDIATLSSTPEGVDGWAMPGVL